MNVHKYDRYVYMLFAGDAPQPFYVGLGKHGTRRHEAHGKYAGRVKCNPAKQQFILECKASGIEIRYAIPETCLTIGEAYKFERALIAIHGRRDLSTGTLFNMNAGGYGGRDPAPSTRAKIGTGQRGKKRTPEHCAKLGAARLGKKHSPEWRANMAELNRGKKMSPESIEKTASAHRGKKRPPEWCANQSKAHLGQVPWNLGKKLSPKRSKEQLEMLPL